MIRFKYILLFLIAGLIFCSCESIIRFASKNSVKSERTTKTDKCPENYYYLSDIDETEDPILIEARKWIGTPYCWGGEDKNCTDCSGFVQTVYAKNGLKLPRTAQELFEYGRKINENSAESSDLVFFSDKSKITHVGIYIGNDYFIHAATSKGVSIASLEDEYYKIRFAGFRRMKN